MHEDVICNLQIMLIYAVSDNKVLQKKKKKKHNI